MTSAQTKTPTSIFLIGMMASGKSTVGRCLAEKLDWDFFDVDKEVEASTGVSIAYIFEKKGRRDSGVGRLRKWRN